MYMKKTRADLLLVSQGLAETRQRAQSIIMSGNVYAGEKKIEKPAQLLLSDSTLTVKRKDHPYVGRGGLKLKAAIDAFNIIIKDRVCLDVGASTGGFTDCLLKEGAEKVYALDVGYGQIDWSLKSNDRVVVLDRINFRYFDPCQLADPIDLITVDVSFISLTKIIPKAVEILRRTMAVILSPSTVILNFVANPTISARLRVNSAKNPDEATGSFVGTQDDILVPTMIALIKPQFEVGRKFVGKKGVVKDKEKQKECVEKIKSFCLERGGTLLGTIPSPVLGQEGNQEYLLAVTF